MTLFDVHILVVMDCNIKTYDIHSVFHRYRFKLKNRNLLLFQHNVKLVGEEGGLDP